MNVPKNPHERRVIIIAELRLRGLSLSEIARREGVLPSAVSRALIMPSSHLEPVIASALGVTPQKLFPERYDDNGHRLCVIREQHRKNRSIKNTAESCPKCKAA